MTMDEIEKSAEEKLMEWTDSIGQNQLQESAECNDESNVALKLMWLKNMNRMFTGKLM